MEGTFPHTVKDIPKDCDSIAAILQKHAHNAAFIYLYLLEKHPTARQVFLDIYEKNLTANATQTACHAVYIDAAEKAAIAYKELIRINPTEKLDQCGNVAKRHGPIKVEQLVKTTNVVQLLQKHVNSSPAFNPACKDGVSPILDVLQVKNSIMDDFLELQDVKWSRGRDSFFGSSKTLYNIQWCPLRLLCLLNVNVQVTRDTEWHEVILGLGVQTTCHVNKKGIVVSKGNLECVLQRVQVTSPFNWLNVNGLLGLNLLHFSIILCEVVKRCKH